jgi:hypothetical protein
MRIVFIDTEFTGEHAFTTLVSVGMVTLCGRELEVNLNDYDEGQVTDWLKENVIRYIDPKSRVNSKVALEKVKNFLNEYREGQQVHLVSAGKLSDVLLLFELWAQDFPDMKYFHCLHCLPDYLNHVGHLDLQTMFFVAGIHYEIDREEFAGMKEGGRRHNALYDAQVVRKCFLKLIEYKCFENIKL